MVATTFGTIIVATMAGFSSSLHHSLFPKATNRGHRSDRILHRHGRETIDKSIAAHEGDGSRSLALAEADPFGGQSIYEATGGIHTYYFCDMRNEDYQSIFANLYFCSHQNETMLYAVYPWMVLDEENPAGVRTACPDTKEECRDMDLTGLGLEHCLEWCGNAAGPGDYCHNEVAIGADDTEVRCASGTFCEHIATEDRGGLCSGTCPATPEDCLAESDKDSRKSCLECEVKCYYVYWGDLVVDGQAIWAYALASLPFRTATGSAVAPLVDCSDLVLDEVDVCPGARDSICLVHDSKKDSFHAALGRKCENSGGLAMVVYYSNTECHSDDVPGDSYLSTPVNIPVVHISYNSGVDLKENKLGSYVNVTTWDAGEECWNDQYCSTTVPCMNDYQFCLFNEDMDEGLWCEDCPEDPVECFFPVEVSTTIVENKVVACANNCAASVEFGTSCKMCGETIAAFEFGVDDPSDRCDFCPEDDVKYPDRVLPLFSSGDTEVRCWQVQSFFSRVDVPKESKNCKLAQLQNYVCGCDGNGYAGAGTEAKRNALLWMPRVSAILSGLGSLSILISVLRVKTRRTNLFHQLMAQMSFFDIIGSVAYAFTTLPIPSDHYVQGSSGNEATCTAQGFFIQVGTVACYTSVSLAVYYFLMIEKGWSETRLKKVRIWFFVCPIVVGMAFAFAGIYFYDNMLLWCNNAAPWWPDIPVAVAILVATLLMVSVCWNVYKTHKRSMRWRQGGGGGSGATGNSMASKVFWQSFWYLMAFYMTWPPYLVLQYFWASGKEYGNYSFILYAGTVVPLQGAWNFFVYARNRQLKLLREWASSKWSNLDVFSTRLFATTSNTKDPSAAPSHAQDRP